MAVLEYRVKTLEPIVIGRSMADRNIVYSMGYVTGTSIWGMLANIYIRKEIKPNVKAEQDELFQKWFLRGGISFGPAYPKDKYSKTNASAKPIPFCVQKDKSKNYYNLLEEEEPDVKTTPLGEYYTWMGDKLFYYAAETRIQFHHQRDRLTGRSIDGLIYNYEAMSEGQVFTGQLKGAEQDLIRFKEIMGSSLEGYLGTSRKTQYGRVKVCFGDCEEDSPVIEKDALISLVCHSPMILINEQGFPDLSVDNIQRVLESKIGKLKIRQMFARSDAVDTFVSKWQAKKPLELCLNPGTVIQIKLTEMNSGTWERLKSVLISGLGVRRGEGFGRIVIMNFSEDPQPDSISNERKMQHFIKPSGSLPKVVQIVFREAAYNQLDRAILELTEERISNGTKSLLANMEALLKKLKVSNLQELDVRFKEKLEELMENNLTAKKKISVLEFWNKDLLIEILLDNTITAENIIEKVFDKDSRIKKFLDLAGISVTKEFIEEIYYKFLSSLYRLSRKEISRQERAEGNCDGK